MWDTILAFNPDNKRKNVTNNTVEKHILRLKEIKNKQKEIEKKKREEEGNEKKVTKKKKNLRVLI